MQQKEDVPIKRRGLEKRVTSQIVNEAPAPKLFVPIRYGGDGHSTADKTALVAAIQAARRSIASVAGVGNERASEKSRGSINSLRRGSALITGRPRTDRELALLEEFNRSRSVASLAEAIAARLRRKTRSEDLIAEAGLTAT